MIGVEPASDIEAAITGRRSVRGFLPTPVSRETVAHLLEVAARAPSGTNMQPWRVIALTGEPLARFCAALVAAETEGREPDGLERAYYPAPLFEPYISRRRKIGWDLYGLLGIGRGETEKMAAHVLRNLRFFGAPVGLLCTIDRRMEIGSWLDYGMFLQNIALAARGRGLESCAMAIFAQYPRSIRAELGLNDDAVIVCGMALGVEDRGEPANALATERVGVEEFCRFEGF
jgi:nitroreductase